MAIKITIAGVDKTDQIDWESLVKEEVLTKEPDSLMFRIKNYDTKTYRPSINDEVILYDTDGTTKIFGGIIIEGHEEVDALVRYYEVTCKDYTHTLDRYLVSATYTAQTGQAIVSDIVSTFVEAGYTATNAVCTVTVNKIVFNYLTVSQSLQKLAEMLGNYDWYVDYNKDIHFFEEGTLLSPFNLTDTSNNFVWNSLKIGHNIHQVRNKIIIRGGDVVGDSFTDKKIADGSQRTFFLGYDLDSLVVEKALAASPTSFSTLTVGRDGVDPEASYDVLYNPNNGLVRFKSSNIPAVNDVVRWTGSPIYPLIIEKQDSASIATYGTFEYVIVDKNIKSRTSASQRADAELAKYGSQYNEGTFTTYTSGLRTGQTININSTIRSISKDYKITRITTTLQSPTSFKYEVSILASEEVGMVDVLNKLLVTDVSKQIDILDNEVVDRLYTYYEDVTVGESVTSSLAHNTLTETATVGESATVQALNYGVIFCVGALTPTSYSRQFILDGSPLSGSTWNDLGTQTWNDVGTKNWIEM